MASTINPDDENRVKRRIVLAGLLAGSAFLVVRRSPSKRNTLTEGLTEKVPDDTADESGTKPSSPSDTGGATVEPDRDSSGIDQGGNTVEEALPSIASFTSHFVKVGGDQVLWLWNGENGLAPVDGIVLPKGASDGSWSFGLDLILNGSSRLVSTLDVGAYWRDLYKPFSIEEGESVSSIISKLNVKHYAGQVYSKHLISNKNMKVLLHVQKERQKLWQSTMHNNRKPIKFFWDGREGHENEVIAILDANCNKDFKLGEVVASIKKGGLPQVFACAVTMPEDLARLIPRTQSLFSKEGNFLGDMRLKGVGADWHGPWPMRRVDDLFTVVDSTIEKGKYDKESSSFQKYPKPFELSAELIDASSSILTQSVGWRYLLTHTNRFGVFTSAKTMNIS